MSDRLPQLIADFKAQGLGHYLRTESDEAALLEGCWVDERKGRYVCEWIERNCCVSDSSPPGKPFRLLPWQRDRVIMPLFSWVRPDPMGGDEWIRRISRLVCILSIGNGKTVFMSALSWYMLRGDEEPAARVFSAANDRKQASLIYAEMANMMKFSPSLSGCATPKDSDKMLVVDSTSFYRALSAEAGTAAGINSHFMVIDELSLFNSRGMKFRDELRGRGRTRKQPIEAIITRAGDDIGVGWEEYCNAKRVQDGPRNGGVIDTTLLSVIFEADPKADILDPAAHAAANPSLGTILDPDKFMREAIAAKKSPRLAARFRMERLGVWGGRDEQWLDGYLWRKYGQTLDESELEGLPCCGGLDLSSTTDLTAWVLCWKRPDGTLILKPHFWLPLAGIIDREERDRMGYRDLARDGWMTLSDGTEIDFVDVAARIAADWQRFKVGQIGFDKALATLIVPYMRDHHGIRDVDPGDEKPRGVVAIPQRTPYLGRGSKALEDAINITGKIVHDGNPIAAQHVKDAKPFTDMDGNVRPVKCDKHRARLRIDFVVAAIMAISRALVYSPRKSGLTFEKII